MQLTTTNQKDNGVISNLRTAGFFVSKSSKTGAQSLKPISRVEFRKKHGYGNAEAKRKYAECLGQLRTIVTADFASNAATMDFGGIAVTKSGTRKYVLKPSTAVAVKVARELTQEEEWDVCARLMGCTVEQAKAMKQLALK